MLFMYLLSYSLQSRSRESVSYTDAPAHTGPNTLTNFYLFAHGIKFSSLRRNREQCALREGIQYYVNIANYKSALRSEWPSIIIIIISQIEKVYI